MLPIRGVQASIIIRTKDAAATLRTTLATLAAQTDQVAVSSGQVT
ncbi:hypothetical protein [Hymenobacter sp. HSC-4F20]|nr:hypothetical protein [Hymenobacter sp. HSC-4F20]